MIKTYANNKLASQTAHPLRSMHFFFRSLDSLMILICKIRRLIMSFLGDFD